MAQRKTVANDNNNTQSHDNVVEIVGQKRKQSQGYGVAKTQNKRWREWGFLNGQADDNDVDEDDDFKHVDCDCVSLHKDHKGHAFDSSEIPTCEHGHSCARCHACGKIYDINMNASTACAVHTGEDTAPWDS